MAVKTISGSEVTMFMDVSDNPGSPSYIEMAAATSCSLTFNQEAIDATNKESGGRKAFINGVSSWTMDCECFLTADDNSATAAVYQNMFLSLDGGHRVAVKFADSSNQSGSEDYIGYGYITSLSWTGGVGEWSTYSISIQGDGALSEA